MKRPQTFFQPICKKLAIGAKSLTSTQPLSATNAGPLSVMPPLENPNIPLVTKDIIMGLDLSLKSPGIAMHYLSTNTWRLYAFAQNNKHPCYGDNLLSPTVNVRLFPRIPDSKKASDAARYQFICEHIGSIRDLNRVKEVKMEFYAFTGRNKREKGEKSKSGNNFKLQELGGACKTMLYKKGIDNITHVVSSSWKKKVVGHGFATKWQVFNHVKTHLVDLSTLFPFEVMDPTKEVPCPIQDLADSMCIAQF